MLQDGLYEQIINKRLDNELAQTAGKLRETATLDYSAKYLKKTNKLVAK